MIISCVCLYVSVSTLILGIFYLVNNVCIFPLIIMLKSLTSLTLYSISLSHAIFHQLF